MSKFYFVVAGRGDFPFSALKKSRCWPATLEDARRIALSCPTVAPYQRIAMASDQRPIPQVWGEESRWELVSVQS